MQELSKWKNSRQGRKGENAVVEKLRTLLDNRWTIFRNLHLPGRKDDIDIALVGPGGVWALEVKAFRGNVRLQNSQWERETKGGWRKLDHNPSHQLKTNAQNVNIYLQRQGLNRWVDGAIVLAEPQPVSHFEASGKFPIWFLPTLDMPTANLITRTPPSDDEIKRVVALFKELATKQVTLEEAKDKKN